MGSFVGADKMRAVRDIYTIPIWLLLGLSGIALLLSFIFILRAMWPRHHARDPMLQNTEKLWFFGDVASLSRDVHRSTMDGCTEQDLEATMVAAIYNLSKNVWIKHNAINWAMAHTIAALIFLFGLGLAYAIAVVNMPL